MKRIESILLPVLLIVLMVSCSKDDVNSISSGTIGYQYIPLNVGSEMVYQVDSISYDEFTGLTDTSTFFIKEIVEEEFDDLEGNSSHLVGIYKRTSDTLPWVKKSNITKKIIGRRFEKLEDNTILIQLVFPIGEDVVWDVNALNTNTKELYSIKSIHESIRVNGVDYDSVIVVDQKEEQNLIEQFLEEEKYAAKIGLIQKRKKAIQTELNGTIKNGFDVRMNLISHN